MGRLADKNILITGGNNRSAGILPRGRARQRDVRFWHKADIDDVCFRR